MGEVKGEVKVRKELLKLDRIELQALNDGFEALIALEGPGGYQHIAGLHGKPSGPLLPSDPLLFLPWHRAYLLAFEQALARFVPGLPIAYWNWTDEAMLRRGIPGRLRSVSYTDKDHGVWLNQLYRAPIDFLGHECYTERAPGEPRDLQPLLQKTREALSQPRYEDFTAAIMDASSGFCAWVGGHMRDKDLAAYDPIFWFHHANLDRIWAQWQKAHPDAAYSASFLDTKLSPFSIAIADILDVEQFDYAYDDTPA